MSGCQPPPHSTPDNSLPATEDLIASQRSHSNRNPFLHQAQLQTHEAVGGEEIQSVYPNLDLLKDSQQNYEDIQNSYEQLKEQLKEHLEEVKTQIGSTKNTPRPCNTRSSQSSDKEKLSQHPQRIVPVVTAVRQADGTYIDKDTHERDVITVLTEVLNNGHNASEKKLQLCNKAVSYLGHHISLGERQLTPERARL